MIPHQAQTRLAIAFTAAVAAIAVYAVAAAVLIVSMSGCQAIADHNAQTRQQLSAAEATAAQARDIAAKVKEAVKGIVPANKEATP